MTSKDNSVAVMTSEDNAWKLDIMSEDPMGFLARQPQTLPRFNDCIWIVQIAILNSAEPVDLTATKKVWRPRTVPALTEVRALLLVSSKKYQKKKDGSGQGAVWELPQGRIVGSDTDVGSALRRVVSEKTGLTVKDIMGGFVPLVVLDSDPDRPVQLKLFLAVTVEELTACGHPGDVTVVPGSGYTEYRWIHQKRDIATLPVSDLHRPLIDRAYTFRPEVWQSAMTYVGQATSALPYQDRYDYFTTAIITREATAGAGRQILLLKRSQDDNGEEKWELPGGMCTLSDETVEQTLHAHVHQKTGLDVKMVLGQLRAQPLVSSGWREVGNQGVIVLPYVVSVGDGALSVPDGVEWRWVQNKEDLAVLRITRHSLKLINAALGMASTLPAVCYQ